jgi:uncharacterized membrane protein
MLKNWMRDVTLAVQVRSGATPALLVWIAVVTVAALTAFAFLCLAGYVWLSLQVGAVFAGLIMAGVFALIALIAVLIATLSRRRARERAILERAARAQGASWLLDPKVLGVAVEAGRALGWERIIPVALLGFLAAQWVRDHRDTDDQAR